MGSYFTDDKTEFQRSEMGYILFFRAISILLAELRLKARGLTEVDRKSVV